MALPRCGALLATVITPLAAADPPSHVEPISVSGVGFDLPAQAPLFGSLGTLSEALMANVTGAQWTNASANYADYSNVTRDFAALGITRANEMSIVDAIQSSNVDLGLLVANAQDYNALNTREQPPNKADPRGSESQNNVLQMRVLASEIRHLNDDLVVQYVAISAFAAQNGVDTALYTNATNRQCLRHAARHQS